jgi:hypothetical protein
MSWTDFYSEIMGEIDRLAGDKVNGCNEPLFRGLSKKSHKLLPSLFRDIDATRDVDNSWKREVTVFSNVISNFPIFHPNSSRNSWEMLSEMQHHGIPTRLLDWSGSFIVALYFALRKFDKQNTPCVWMLNPLKLNRESIKKSQVISVYSDSKFDYYKMFIIKKDESQPDRKSITFEKPVAIFPIRSHPRIVAQNSFFTLHGTILKPMDEIYSTDVVKRFDIPSDIIPDAKKLFKMINMNEFSLYPDLDGLGRHIKDKYFSENSYN